MGSSMQVDDSPYEKAFRAALAYVERTGCDVLETPSQGLFVMRDGAERVAVAVAVMTALVPEGPAMSELTMERALELRADRIDYITLRVLDNGKALLRHMRDVFRLAAEV